MQIHYATMQNHGSFESMCHSDAPRDYQCHSVLLQSNLRVPAVYRPHRTRVRTFANPASFTHLLDPRIVTMGSQPAKPHLSFRTPPAGMAAGLPKPSARCSHFFLDVVYEVCTGHARSHQRQRA
ncbi:hypothetical protein FKP32DRAFT_1293972 [Trametes sanguinea]|nr:hypothetical protein FKP32DRAFT_1293972 [Trametes sanguinea]